MRIARPGRGKRDGYRTIIAYKADNRAFFLYGFGKNERANMNGDEADALDDYRALLLGQTDEQIEEQAAEGKIREIMG